MSFSKNQKTWVVFLVTIVLLVVIFWYMPMSWRRADSVNFVVQKGWGSSEIAKALSREHLITSDMLFRLYVLIFNQHGKLQAGTYALSPSLSMVQIAKIITEGQTIKNTVTIIEGWDTQDMAEFFENKNIYSSAEFLQAVKNSPTAFDFLNDKPTKLSLEGYLFPDTYEVAGSETASDLVRDMLINFDKKLTPDLRTEIKKQKKTIFQIVTMASILEKEVKTLDDKKMVAGILWKRIAEGMPLQVDATVNYITRKDHAGALIADTKIDSLYNTYKYYGLPKGPISNPGLDSLKAAIYPIKTDYWFYLSDQKTGKTIFSKTLDEHNRAAVKYLK